MTSNIHPIDKLCIELNRPIIGLEADIQNRIVIERYVLPIIFVPGIMGSRLGKSEKDKVWDPDSLWFMFTNYGRRKSDAAMKRLLLIGEQFNQDYLQVLKHSEKIEDSQDKRRRERGWGGVAWMSYGPLLKELQTRKWDNTVNLFFEFPVHCFGYNWTASNELAGEKLATYINEVMKTYTDKGRKCEKVILVTHSMGGLVARSACMLSGARDKVLGVIHGVQPANGSPTAYWRMKGGFERPHTIPEINFFHWLSNPSKAYRHMKGKFLSSSLLGIPFTNLKIGAGHISAWVLGTDGEEVTALLGNMPGGLQLLPNKRYRNYDDSGAWLQFLNAKGEQVELPKDDPYEEIYRNDKEYYRLINPEWLNPGERNSSELHEDVSSWDFFLGYLAEAEQFHKDLGDQVHQQTYQFYSSGIATADRIVFSRSEDTLWQSLKRYLGTVGKDMPKDIKSTGKSFVFTVCRGGLPLARKLIDAVIDAAGGALVKDSDWYQNRGGYRDRVDDWDAPSDIGPLNLVTMQLPDGAGDGTVPESSGMSLKLDEDTKRTFCIADKEGFEADFVKENAPRTKPKRKVDFDESWFDRGHEPIFKTKSAQYITFTAIENICRNEIKRMLGET